MGRARRGSSAADAGPRRNVLTTERWCEACDREAVFDGNGGEWCEHCQTAEHLRTRRRLYSLVDVDLDLSAL